MKFSRFAVVLICAAVLSACGQKKIPVDSVSAVVDEQIIIQSPVYFADKLPFGGRDLLDYAEQQTQYALFKKHFTAAWKQTKPYKGNLAYFRSYVQVSPEKRGFAENLRRWSDKHYQALAYNAQYETFPSMAKNALIVKDTSLRLAPTDKPYFINPKRPGQAYPFDMFQNSTLRAGAAAKVFHVSYDNAWYYVEAASAGGWVRKEHLAFTDEETENLWKHSADYAAVVKDGSLVKNDAVREAVNLGSVFPLLEESPYGFTVAVPLRGVYGDVRIERCYIAKDRAVKMPVPLKADTVAEYAEQLMGNLYGWGGMYNNRDCSSTLQDLFAPFGIWLPRNSAQQAKAGHRLVLGDVSDGEKEERIRVHGIPFQTLIYLPGHIGLYVGQHEGKALMLHNMWGVRINEYGRFVVGKTVITTLYPGEELEGFGSSLMSRVQSLTVVGKE